MKSSLFAIITLTLSACATQPTPTPFQPIPSPAPIVGGDRDAHGCIASAGYTWCARESACVRPWELSAEKHLAQGVDAFQQYCTSKP
ncbi:MAG: hypothetical protein PHU06_05750 [Gallionella sp.]|nr:hypothetical protein [Gallionella sp.]MDD4958086.1 hypothetical protein [Gallionella sp.]